MQLFYSCCGKAVNYEINTLQVLYFTRSVPVSNTKIKFLPLLLDPGIGRHSSKKQAIDYEVNNIYLVLLTRTDLVKYNTCSVLVS